MRRVWFNTGPSPCVGASLRGGGDASSGPGPVSNKRKQPKSKAERPIGNGGGGGGGGGKPSAKAEGNVPKDTTEVAEDDGEGGSKKVKKDPQVAARLQKLQNEKDLLLTKDRWSVRVKSLNEEVTESMAAAEAHEQTKGCLNKNNLDCLKFLDALCFFCSRECFQVLCLRESVQFSVNWRLDVYTAGCGKRWHPCS